jgi:hypothetical protein
VHHGSLHRNAPEWQEYFRAAKSFTAEELPALSSADIAKELCRTNPAYKWGMVLLEYSTTICKTCAALLAGKFEEVSTGLMIEPAWRKVLPSVEGSGSRSLSASHMASARVAA